MTTKSPASTCGANCGLCLPRSRIAVWLASRPSTTSVASMTCQARVMSPGLGVYVRTRLTVLRRRAGGWWDRLTEHGRLGSSDDIGTPDTRAPTGVAHQPTRLPARAVQPSPGLLQGPAARLRAVGA